MPSDQPSADQLMAELFAGLLTPAEADMVLAAGYDPDPDCACEGKCRWCAVMGCETCCDSYAADHGAKGGDPDEY